VHAHDEATGRCVGDVWNYALQQSERFTYLCKQRHGFSGRDHAAPGAAKERGAELHLELADAVADRAVRDVELLRRRRIALEACSSLECPQRLHRGEASHKCIVTISHRLREYISFACVAHSADPARSAVATGNR
jgi:hypothetical protein